MAAPPWLAQPGMRKRRLLAGTDPDPPRQDNRSDMLKIPLLF